MNVRSALDQRRMKSGARSKLGKPFVDEIVADMNAAALNSRVVGGFHHTFAGKIEGCLCYLGFGAVGVTGNESDALPIELAAVEIH